MWLWLDKRLFGGEKLEGLVGRDGGELVMLIARDGDGLEAVLARDGEERGETIITG